MSAVEDEVPARDVILVLGPLHVASLLARAQVAFPPAFLRHFQAFAAPQPQHSSAAGLPAFAA